MAPTLESNAFTLGDLSFWALGDRIIVQEDAFKSGYECETCNGKGQTTCDNCSGTKEVNGKKCSFCDSGTITCPTCLGKGGFLVVPETSERRPTTGRIVSAGDDCVRAKVGDTIMFSSFAGYVVDLDRAGQKVVLRLLHENEILCAISGHLLMRDLRHKSEIALPQGR